MPLIYSWRFPWEGSATNSQDGLNRVHWPTKDLGKGAAVGRNQNQHQRKLLRPFRAQVVAILFPRAYALGYPARPLRGHWFRDRNQLVSGSKLALEGRLR